MQKQYRNKNLLWPNPRNQRQQIESRGDIEDRRISDKIQNNNAIKDPRHVSLSNSDGTSPPKFRQSAPCKVIKGEKNICVDEQIHLRPLSSSQREQMIEVTLFRFYPTFIKVDHWLCVLPRVDQVDTAVTKISKRRNVERSFS